MNDEQVALLEEWRHLKAEVERLAPTIAKERELRARVFTAFYPTPKEGTNTAELQDGWKLKGFYKLDRKVDEASLQAVSEQLRSMGVNSETLVGWEPKLKTATYRELTAEQRATFDQALTIKPGSPTLELLPPEEKD